MKYLKNENFAKDGTQQIFEKCIDELHKYDVAYFKSWVYMITKNYCLMQLRKLGQNTNIDVDTLANSIPQADTDYNYTQLKQKDTTLDIMLDSLNQLTNEQKECITLFYLQKKTYQQISEQLQLNYMQVKSNLQNGKRNLKMIIEKKIATK